ncbi:hypothetical protein [Carnobacterium pleistocenium]|uniref:hypothetical protein n=1 Tax=Carnobacterium pleistocenium TaxID=181073 RepID=UPI00054F541A|nr:hypothetical protein [Carnobacterium pleistocenium]
MAPFDYHMTFPRGYNHPSLKEQRILAKHNQTDKDVQINALKRYLKTEKKDLIKLIHYAKLFKVDHELRSYLEVLI